jgi:hypothetical protein
MMSTLLSFWSCLPCRIKHYALFPCKYLFYCRVCYRWYGGLVYHAKCSFLVKPTIIFNEQMSLPHQKSPLNMDSNAAHLHVGLRVTTWPIKSTFRRQDLTTNMVPVPTMLRFIFGQSLSLLMKAHECTQLVWVKAHFAKQIMRDDHFLLSKH